MPWSTLHILIDEKSNLAASDVAGRAVPAQIPSIARTCPVQERLPSRPKTTSTSYDAAIPIYRNGQVI